MFYEFLRQNMELHNRKNRDYAFGGHPFGNFHRVASILKLYPNFPFATAKGVAWIFALKQLDAVFNSWSAGHELLQDSRLERHRDINVYGAIAAIADEEERTGQDLSMGVQVGVRDKCERAPSS